LQHVLQLSTIRLPLQSLFSKKKNMANHKSAEKRIRANETKRVRNRYQHKTTRTAIKKLKTTTSKTDAEALLKEVSAMIDKLAKKNIIHWKKAANQKSKLAKQVNKIAK
jgi:small subunit ribosomal protein S20